MDKFKKGEVIYHLRGITNKNIEKFVIEKVGVKFVYLKTKGFSWESERKMLKEDLIDRINDQEIFRKYWFESIEEAEVALKLEKILYSIRNQDSFKKLSSNEIEEIYKILFKK